jgi:hypothetical protein
MLTEGFIHEIVKAVRRIRLVNSPVNFAVPTEIILSCIKPDENQIECTKRQ